MALFAEQQSLSKGQSHKKAKLRAPSCSPKHLCVASSRHFLLLRSLSSLPEVRRKQIHPHKHRQAEDTVALAAAGEMQAILIWLLMADLTYSSR